MRAGESGAAPGNIHPTHTPAQLLRDTLTGVGSEVPYLFEVVLQLQRQYIRVPHREPSRPRQAQGGHLAFRESSRGDHPRVLQLR